MELFVLGQHREGEKRVQDQRAREIIANHEPIRTRAEDVPFGPSWTSRSSFLQIALDGGMVMSFPNLVCDHIDSER